MARSHSLPSPGWLWLCSSLYLFAMLSYSDDVHAQPFTISNWEVVIDFKGHNPSFVFSFNKTTFGAGETFYTSNNQNAIVEKIPNQPDIYHQLPTNFESVTTGNLTYKDGNRTIPIICANFSNPLMDGNQTLATLMAEVFLVENATVYNWTVPRTPISSNNTQHLSVTLPENSVLFFTRVTNWHFRNPGESLQVRGSVKSSAGPLSVFYSKYGSPTNNLKTVGLRGGEKTLVVHVVNNATLYCRGVVRSAYVDVSYDVTSITSPIAADISITFPSFGVVFGNDTQALCGESDGGGDMDNFIEYYGYFVLINDEAPINWILVGAILAGGGVLLCCMVSMVLVVRWQYNKRMARMKEETKEDEERRKEKIRQEEEEATRSLLQKKPVIYTTGHYDYLLKKPIEEIIIVNNNDNNK